MGVENPTAGRAVDLNGECRPCLRMASILAILGLVAWMLMASESPASAATCPTVAPVTGVVTPPPAPGVNWSGCHLDGANLSYADLSDANLTGATFYNGADLNHANLSYTNLYFAQLSEADLSYANLGYANLSHAYAGYSDLGYANLGRADLSHVYLEYTDLANADLSYADMHSANVYSTNLRDADLSYARADEVTWVFATCPDGLSSEKRASRGCAPSLSIKAPDNVPAGSRVKITGVLRDDDAACSAAQPVTLKNGSHTAGTTLTRANGAYAFVLKIQRTSRLGVVYKGAPTCAGNSSGRSRIWAS
jgi:hypothetical protein